MLEIRQIKLNVNHTENDLKNYLVKHLNLKSILGNKIDLVSLRIIRKSIDARKKPEIYFIYSVVLDFEATGNSREIEKKILFINSKKKNKEKLDISIYNPVIYKIPSKNDECIDDEYKCPVVVGSGPAGLFCAYLLALAGLRPVVFERGEDVDSRKKTVDKFWETGELNQESNVQFGEGGAGTFSDGKLNTLTKDKYGRQEFVLKTFVKFGAPERILYDAKPHIGTDILITVVKNLRNEIINLGGRVEFLSKLTSINYSKDNSINSVVINDEKVELCKNLVLAIGHSSRDTFETLKGHGINMEQKNFAVGFRVMHSQNLINESQYGENYPECLEAAPYKVANETSNGRRVYSFCMCPGGYVVNASSEKDRICVNGMSYSKRDSNHANSAIIISVNSDDFKKEIDKSPDDPLLGMYYQQKLENKAYILGDGNIPAQKFEDFEKNTIGKISSSDFSVKGKFTEANLNSIYSEDMNQAFVEAMHNFGRQIKGFDGKDTMLFGIESRTSSPVRIIRDDDFESNIKGIYPCGEGAGYAGGIMSAAVDGMKVAEAIINKISKEG